LVAICTKNPTLTASDGTEVDMHTACAALAGWDLKADVDSRGAVLWDEFINRLGGSDIQPGSWWTVPFDPAHPLTTPRGVDTTDPDISKVFADTVEFFQHNHIAPNVSLGDTQQYSSLPIPGCPDRSGCFNAISPSTGLDANGRYGPVDFGSSFIMAVELTANG